MQRFIIAHLQVQNEGQTGKVRNIRVLQHIFQKTPKVIALSSPPQYHSDPQLAEMSALQYKQEETA